MKEDEDEEEEEDSLFASEEPFGMIVKLILAKFTVKKKWLPTNGRTDGPTDQPTDGATDGRKKPLIELRIRI